MATNSGLRARSAGVNAASSHASWTTRVSSTSRSGRPGMVAATPTRRDPTSNRWTGPNAGRPDNIPDSNASVPRPYPLRTAAPVTTTVPAPLRAGTVAAATEGPSVIAMTRP